VPERGGRGDGKSEVVRWERASTVVGGEKERSSRNIAVVRKSGGEKTKNGSGGKRTILKNCTVRGRQGVGEKKGHF